MFACQRHWTMVPSWLKKLLWAVYVPGQEETKQVSRIYLLVQARCRVAIALAEQADVGTQALLPLPVSTEDRTALPMALIRSLAASSERRSLHDAISGRSDADTLQILDAGLPALVAAHVRRRESAHA
jgi:hypothetical protein